MSQRLGPQRRLIVGLRGDAIESRRSARYVYDNEIVSSEYRAFPVYITDRQREPAEAELATYLLTGKKLFLEIKWLPSQGAKRTHTRSAIAKDVHQLYTKLARRSFEVLVLLLEQASVRCTAAACSAGAVLGVVTSLSSFSGQVSSIASFNTRYVPSTSRTNQPRASTVSVNPSLTHIPRIPIREMPKAREGSVAACRFRGSELRDFAMYDVYA